MTSMKDSADKDQGMVTYLHIIKKSNVNERFTWKYFYTVQPIWLQAWDQASATAGITLTKVFYI